MNLFNHILALFRTKFVYNSTIRYPVFRWESCKNYVWKNVKNSSVYALKEFLVTGTREWLTTDDSLKCHTCETYRKLKVHDIWSTIGQKMAVWPVSYFVTESCDLSQSQVSHQNTLFCKKMTFHIPQVPYYKYPYTHEL